MKEQVLRAIYTEFEEWSSQLQLSCQKGCAFCCTQNVTLTALEGNRIHNYLSTSGREKEFAQLLCANRHIHPAHITTNDYATACFQGQDVNPVEKDNPSPCPFLNNNCCTIYEVRPFSCRCFGSQVRCSSKQAALLPEYYISASTVVMQLIEHLGQFECWGNMIHVLTALSGEPQNREIVTFFSDPNLPGLAQKQVLTAQPLPGFLVPEEDMEVIQPLLEAIFSTHVGPKSIEQFLNNQ